MKQVRSGARASEDTLNYHITTSDAKQYLQEKFNFIVESARKKGANVPDVKITMYTAKLGKTFFPFMLIMPEEVLETSEFKNWDVNPIFLPADEDRRPKLKNLFYNLVRAYTYNKADKQAFHSSEWKRSRGVTANVIGTLLRYATPCKEKLNGVGTKVIVLIDPIRLFHDMLVDKTAPQQRFNVWIDYWRKIDDGNFDFTITREVYKKKGEDQDSIYAQMLRKINSR